MFKHILLLLAAVPSPRGGVLPGSGPSPAAWGTRCYTVDIDAGASEAWITRIRLDTGVLTRIVQVDGDLDALWRVTSLAREGDQILSCGGHNGYVAAIDLHTGYLRVGGHACDGISRWRGADDDLGELALLNGTRERLDMYPDAQSAFHNTHRGEIEGVPGDLDAITISGDDLYGATWWASEVEILDLRTGAASAITLEGFYAEFEGLAVADGELIVLDGQNQLRYFDPATGNSLGILDLASADPGRALRGLYCDVGI